LLGAWFSIRWRNPSVQGNRDSDRRWEQLWISWESARWSILCSSGFWEWGPPIKHRLEVKSACTFSGCCNRRGQVEGRENRTQNSCRAHRLGSGPCTLESCPHLPLPIQRLLLGSEQACQGLWASEGVTWVSQPSASRPNSVYHHLTV
jgi:hypothetical protein